MKIKGGGAGFLPMVIAIVGLVVYVTMFPTVLSGLATLYTTTGVANFTAFQTILRISPTILFIAGIFGAGFAYYRGYRAYATGGGDPSGLIRMVLGVLSIILFVTLFATVLTNMNTLYSSANTTWIAFGTVVSISPTVLFLAGLFAGGATTYSGYKARKSRRSLR